MLDQTRNVMGSDMTGEGTPNGKTKACELSLILKELIRLEMV